MDSETEISAKDLAKFQAKRNIVALYKNFLLILEDICDETSYRNFSKYRKRVLDQGNDTIREIESQIEKFNIEYPKRYENRKTKSI